MIRNSIRTKTVIGIALIEAVLLIALILLMLGFIKETNFKALETRAESTAHLFATTVKDSFLSYDLATLETFVAEVMRNDDLVYARVITKEGQILADSKTQIPGELDRSVESVKDGIYDTRAVISEGGKTYGWVEVGFSINPILAVIANAQQWSITIASLEMILVALFSLALGRYLTNKLTTLREAANQVSRGELTTQINVKGRDEVDEVATAFNQMTDHLLSSRAQEKKLQLELLKLNESLEQKVKDRTHQLQQKNTLLENANREIQLAQQKLLSAEKHATVGVLAAGIAHEVNNPLSVVRSNIGTINTYIKLLAEALEAIKSKADQGENVSSDELAALIAKSDLSYIQDDYPELIEDTATGVTRVRDIIEQLRAFETSAEAASNSQCYLQRALQNAKNRIPTELTQGVEYSLSDDSPVDLPCREEFVTEVLAAVLMNSYQAVRNVTKPSISIALEKSGKDLAIQICDNGEGIEEAILNKVFDPFFTTRDIGAGMGLGLYKARALITAMQGSIELENNKEKGVCVTIKLPLAIT